MSFNARMWFEDVIELIEFKGTLKELYKHIQFLEDLSEGKNRDNSYSVGLKI